MNEKKEKEPKITCMEDIIKLSRDEQMKYEIAEELGLEKKVFSDGWRSLSAKESGRIGGILAARKKTLKQRNAR